MNIKTRRLLSIITAAAMTVSSVSFTSFADDSVPQLSYGESNGVIVGAETTADGSVEINETNFPDATFREYVSMEFDLDGDGSLSASEIEIASGIFVSERGIESLKGIEYFTELKALYCNSNQLTSLDVSKNTALSYLNCALNQLTSLDLSQNTALSYLYCNSNQLTSLDVSKNTALSELSFGNNQLTSLDLSKNTALISLICTDNKLTSLDVSNNTALTYLACSGNQLTSLDLSKNTKLKNILCGSNPLTSLDVSGCTLLERLDCYDDELTSLDVSNSPALEFLNIYRNNVGYLDLSANTALRELNCSNNKLAFLDLSANTALETFYCWDNAHEINSWEELEQLKEMGFDLSKATNLDGAEYDAETDTLNVYNENLSYNYPTYGENTATFDIHIGISVCEINEENFPDEILREFVAIYDWNEDGILSEVEKNKIVSINLNGEPLTSLKGIEYLTAVNGIFVSKRDEDGNALGQITSIDLSALPNLQTLDISGNPITELDISKNPNLVHIFAGGCGLKTIDVSNCPDLIVLDAWNNQFTEIDLSGNPSLDCLNVDGNNISYLDLSANTALRELHCSGNKLAFIDLSANTALEKVGCWSNTYEINSWEEFEQLKEMGFDLSKATELDGGEYNAETGEFTIKSSFFSYRYPTIGEAGEMFGISFNLPVCEINEENFPDEILRSFVATYDGDEDGALSPEEISYIDGVYLDGEAVTSLKGIEYLTAVRGIFVGNIDENGNAAGQITSIDLSNLSELESLSISGNPINELDLSNNPKLKNIWASCCGLTSLDVSLCPDLEILDIWGNQLTEINLKNNTALKELNLDGNLLKDIDLSSNSAIERLRLGGNQIKSIDISNLTDLKTIDLSSNPLEEVPDLSGYTNMEVLMLGGLDLAAIDVSGMTSLRELGLWANALTEIDLSNNTALESLNLDGNLISYLDLSANTALRELRCSGNRLAFIDLSANTALNLVECRDNYFEISDYDQFNTLEELGMVFSKATNWDGAEYDAETNMLNIFSDCVSYDYPTFGENTERFEINIKVPVCDINEENFPDETLRNFVADFDFDGDGILSEGEISSIDGIYLDGQPLTSLQGIEYLTAVKGIYVGCLDSEGNPCGTLTSIDVSMLPQLEELFVHGNPIETLDVSNNPNLIKIDAGFCGLTSLDLSKNPNIEYLFLCGNQLTTIDISHLTELKGLDLSDNPLETVPDVSGFTMMEEMWLGSLNLEAIDVSAMENLRELGLWNNALTEIDLSGNPALEILNVDSNKIRYLDLSANTALKELRCNRNNLAFLDLSANTALEIVQCPGNVYYVESMDEISAIIDMGLDLSVATSFEGGEYDAETGELTVYGSWLAYEYPTFGDQFEKFKICVYVPDVEITEENFPDPVLRSCVATYDFDENGILSADENFFIEGLWLADSPLADLTGAELLAALKEVQVNGTSVTDLSPISNLKSLELLNINDTLIEGDLDFSGNPNLLALDFYGSRISGADVSNCPKLISFNGTSPFFTSVDFTNNTRLEYVTIGESPLTELDVSNCPKLKVLNLWGSKVSEIDVTNCPELIELNVQSNGVSAVDVSRNTKLELLGIGDNPDLAEIDISNNTALKELHFWNTPIKNVDLSNAPELLILSASGAPLESLDVSNNTKLSYINIGGGTMDSLDLSKNTALSELCVWGTNITSLDLSNNTLLTAVRLNGLPILTLDLSKNTELMEIELNGNGIDLTSFTVTELDDYNVDLSKITGWTGAKFDPETKTLSDIEEDAEKIVYTYDLGNGSTAEFELRIPVPEAPEVTAKGGSGKVTLSWKPVNMATSYVVYSYDGKDLEIIGETSETSFVVDGLKNGTEYRFFVSARCGAMETEFDDKYIVKAKPAVAVPVKPANVKVDPSDGEVYVSWTASEGATSYSVYKYEGGKYSKLYSTTETGCTIRGLTNGTTYMFLVRAFNESGGSAFTTADLVSGTPKAPVVIPEKPTNVKATAGDKQVTLTWTAAAGAESYTIYKYENSKYTKINSTAKTTYTVTGLTNGTAYKFLVRAFNEAGGNSFTLADLVSATPKAPVASVPAKPANVKATAGDKQVTLSWTASTGATSYTIYRYNNGKYGKVTSTASTSFTIKGLANGTTYKFLVRAFNAKGGSSFTTADLVSATPKAAVTTVPAKPTVSANVQDKVVTFSWNAVAGATYYKLYNYSNGNYGLIATVTDTTYRLRYLKNGTTYQILVRAFNEKGGSAFTTADLISVTPKAATTSPDKPVVTATVSNGNVNLTWAHVPTAYSYTIYKYENGTYTKLGATCDNYFTVKGLAAGKTYKLLVRSFNSKSGHKVTSADLVTVTL